MYMYTWQHGLRPFFNACMKLGISQIMVTLGLQAAPGSTSEPNPQIDRLTPDCSFDWSSAIESFIKEKELHMGGQNSCAGILQKQ